MNVATRAIGQRFGRSPLTVFACAISVEERLNAHRLVVVTSSGAKNFLDLKIKPQFQ